MKIFVLAGVMGTVVLTGSIACQAEKWDKNDFTNKSIESGYYDAGSIKVKDKAISWTEKNILTDYGVINVKRGLAKYQACKQNIEKKGDPIQFQNDFQIENGKIKQIAKRYYNKANEILCTDKDAGKDFNSSWTKIQRNSQAEKEYYDLITKYKIIVPK